MTLPVDLQFSLHQDGLRLQVDTDGRLCDEVRLTSPLGEQCWLPIGCLRQLAGWLVALADVLDATHRWPATGKEGR